MIHRFRYMVLAVLALCLYISASAQWKGSVNVGASYKFTFDFTLPAKASYQSELRTASLLSRAVAVGMKWES